MLGSGTATAVTVKRPVAVSQLYDEPAPKPTSEIFGVPVKEAFFAAGMFAHTGEEAIEGLHPERVPGMPFNGDGRTFLAISGDKSDVFFNDYDRSILSDMFLRLGNVDGITVVDISAIFDRLVAALGHHPSAVMDIAYGGTMRASEF